MKKTSYDMLYLVTCAINGTVPDKNKIAQMNLQNLFQMCQFHCVTAIVDNTLESVGIKDKQFIEAESKAISKNIMLDMERKEICGFMEDNSIWHMSLKGVVLKELYPKIGMRQMADNDILYDLRYQKQVMNYMKNRGYKTVSVGKGNHDVYMKESIYNYELHTGLFGKSHNENFYNYYKNVKKRLVKDDDKNNSYHFTDEDFYIYITAHEYKHYCASGTGLRSLIDCYVYLKSKGDSMDWNYISKQLKILKIADFEEKSRNLAQKVFDVSESENLSDSEISMLEYYLFSGTYGTIENCVENGIKKIGGSRSKYLIKRAFPPLDFYKKNYPFIYKTKILIPFFTVYRIFRAIILRRKNICTEIKAIKNSTV
jgi:hypothetical protein